MTGSLYLYGALGIAGAYLLFRPRAAQAGASRTTPPVTGGAGAPAPPLPQSRDVIALIAQAIATMEGYYVTAAQARERGIRHPTLAQRNRNPGNLRSWGGNPIVDGYAQFPTDAEGWRALRRQIELNIGRGLNLYEFFAGKPGVYAGYSPAADGNRPREYAEFVARRAGLNPNLPISGQMG